ncbi:MAG: hypothetical protein IT542_00770, partial [Rubellimicrobium sp.]|nr:hypothetical protein [Rubellimicrobium sp.]
MRALALIAALAALPAGLARAEGASGAPLLRPLARPVATAPLRPLARGEGALARQDSAPAGARPLARPQSVAQAAELARMLNETGTRLQRAEMPPLPQDRGTALAAATADELAVPGHLLEGRVSTMGAGSVPARLAHVEGLVDSLLGPDDPAAAVPVPVPVPAALVVPLAPAGPWAGPAPRLRPATLGQYVPGVRPAPRS